MNKAIIGLLGLLGGAALAVGPGCGGAGGPSPSAPACDQTCLDQVAMRALRITLKEVFNGTVQSTAVGAKDFPSYGCFLGGTASVKGNVTSNASVGTTSVDLTYVLDGCHYISVDTDPTQNYDTILTGTVTEHGIIAVQPGNTTVLTIASDAMTFAGTVYSPPIPYQADGVQDAGGPDAAPAGTCPVQLGQDGNQLSGTICGRAAGVAL